MKDKIETIECLDMNTLAKYIPGVFETIKAKHSFKKGNCNTSKCCKKTCAEVCSSNRQCDSNWKNICEGNCTDISNHLFSKINGSEYVQDVPNGLFVPEVQIPILYPDRQSYSMLGSQYPYMYSGRRSRPYNYMYYTPVQKNMGQI